MSDPAGGTRAAGRPWRSPAFLLTFVPGACAWLAFVGWLTWLYFHPVTDWVDRHNEFLQELLQIVLLLAWALGLAFGIGAAAVVAERVAGTRPPAAPGQTHGRHAGWHRPT